MKKFECKDCENRCEATMQTDEYIPSFCLYDTVEVNWREVEDSEENEHTSVNSEQLPKLTAEVFDHPDCPEWARYAAVNADGSVRVFLNKPTHLCSIYWYDLTSCWEQTLKHSGKYDASDWKNSMVERPLKALPNWCKVGKWGYDKSREKYFEIVAVRKPFNVEVAYLDDALTTVIGSSIFNVDCVQANKRPFNEVEMQNLIGKMFESSYCNFLITGYNRKTNYVKVNEMWFNAEELMNGKTSMNPPLIDGKPCYVLEHLNKKGEWVR